jgi:hypothetical protein
LGHKPLERKTEKDLDDEHMLGDELQKVRGDAVRSCTEQMALAALARYLAAL